MDAGVCVCVCGHRVLYRRRSGKFTAKQWNLFESLNFPDACYLLKPVAGARVSVLVGVLLRVSSKVYFPECINDVTLVLFVVPPLICNSANQSST